MDEKTSSAPMQEDPQKGEELSFTITGEDAEAQDALVQQFMKRVQALEGTDAA
mgnify:CR=1 FL=1